LSNIQLACKLQKKSKPARLQVRFTHRMAKQDKVILQQAINC